MTPTPKEGPPMLLQLEWALKSGYDGEDTWSVWKARAQKYARHAISLHKALERDELKRTEELSEAYNRGFQEAQALYE